MPDTSLVENTLLVSTIPSQQITFYADDPSSYQQVLTIFNQYEFPVKFRILVSTSDSSKYTVFVPQGIIRAQHSVVIVLTHKSVIPANIGVTDKIRVQLMSTRHVLASGKKDLLVTLLPSCERVNVPKPSMEPERFHQLQADSSGMSHLRQNPMLQDRNRNSDQFTTFRMLQIFLAGLFLGIALTCYYFMS